MKNLTHTYPKGTKPVVISSSESNVTKFKEIFKISPTDARVFCANNTVTVNEFLLFEQSKTKFQLIKATSTYGVSKTDKIYVRRKRNRRILVNAPKFYIIDETKKIKCLSVFDLSTDEYEVFKKYFPWCQFLKDFGVNIVMNTIFSKKLFNLKKALNHLYKVPNPGCAKIHKLGFNKYQWKSIRERLTHVENCFRMLTI